MKWYAKILLVLAMLCSPLIVILSFILLTEISIAEAKRLSIIKWEMIVKQNGDDKGTDEHPELKKLNNNCGFCERWRYPTNKVGEYNTGSDCGKCEFAKAQGTYCSNDDIPNVYTEWCDSDYPSSESKQLAQQILDLIISIPE